MPYNQTDLIHNTPWDTLIILDSCRFDAFELVYGKYLKGDLTKVRSPATCTRDWLSRTWTKEYLDVTYISQNMFMQSKDTKHPCQFENRHKFGRIIDLFLREDDEELIPQDMNREALKHKGRKVLHYNAPHFPFLGEIQTETVEGYHSNLEHVLGYVTTLLPFLEGTSIITSDHGELLPPHFRFIHPCNPKYTILFEVPWLENIEVLK